MNISYVTTYDALDIHNWSGLGFSIAKSLENQNANLDYIGNLKKNISLASKLKEIAYPNIFNKRFDTNRDLSVAKKYTDQVSKRLKSSSDIIFSPGTIPIAFLESKKPKVIYTDATFASMIGFYDSFSNYCDETIKNGNYIEKIALESSSMAIFSSEWAANSAVENYGIKPEKTHVIPFGANLENQFEHTEIKNIVKSRSSKSLDLLFVGVDWVRKGGDLAVKITNQLNFHGIPTTLHIVGISQLPNNISSCNIINYGYISKRTDEGRYHLMSLYQKCHFLLLPSQAECSGVVFCEANSFGLPSLTHDVGGTSTIIKNDQNGFIFPLNSDVNTWCNYISKVFLDKLRYLELCLNSYYEFDTRLNWNVAGGKIKALLSDL